ncbi:helix-turn-helix domain-containing protein [Streptomyces phaeochromogenes]|uniref:helix-turn-helix domain-containing protein n=1 Tax=Streptomyces phaeochromogenes TaxID=1923 RepID=UPI002DD89CCF|nr:cupin domain-containing protein [Streptomyces phaeochromogenes]WRZ34437.1 cupin domain-containing protein [Streptomyces phaeochromogenes]
MSEATAASPDNGMNIGVLVATVGVQIKVLRKQAGLTLDDLSRRSGVSTGLISQVERGKGNPSFASMVQIAHGLEVPVGRLFHLTEQISPVVRSTERRTLEFHNTGVGEPNDARYELLSPSLGGALEVLWVETQPGHDTRENPFRHNGEEFGIVLSGVKDVYLDGVRHRLEAGDSITYSSSVPHWYANPGDEPTTSIWVVTPPTW